MAKSAVKFKDCLAQYESLTADIAARRFAPLYLLAGDEGYFIDALCRQLSSTILDEAQRSFNQITVYGLDSDAGAIVNMCRQMPMMGSYEVIIVREAQHLQRIENLSHYTTKPQPTTILIVCYKNKESGRGIDRRGSFYKSCVKNGVVFESVRPRDYEIDSWLTARIGRSGMSMQPKAVAMLKEQLGCDLARIDGELQKLAVSLPENTKVVTDEHIERYVGISKEFNTYELCNAVMRQDVERSMRIADHFGRNPKAYPIIVTISVLFGQFRQMFLLGYLMWQTRRRGVPFPSDAELMRTLGVGNIFAIRDMKENIARWNNRRLFNVLGLLREYDAKSKGLDSGGLDQDELLRELLLKIFSSRQ